LSILNGLKLVENYIKLTGNFNIITIHAYLEVAVTPTKLSIHLKTGSPLEILFCW